MSETSAGIGELTAVVGRLDRDLRKSVASMSIEQARVAAPHNNATSLQVTAAVLGGLVWAIENPRAGVVEADDLDHTRVLEVARPYLGDVLGQYTDWTPLQDRGRLFSEDVDTTCPWQFRNIRVV